MAAYAELIEGLVELRHHRRLTQADVAEAMGTTQSVVSHFERLGGDTRISTVQRYARAVGAQLHWRTRIPVTLDPAALALAPAPAPRPAR